MQCGPASWWQQPTVTAVFRTKPALLQALIQSTVRGDEAPVPLALRPEWQEMLDEPNPVRQLARYAAQVRRIHERTTDIFEIVRGAATADAELAELRRELGIRRLGDMRTVAESLQQKAALCPGMHVDEATDLLWALGSAEMFRMLVVDRSWPPQWYEHRLTRLLQEAILCGQEEAV